MATQEFTPTAEGRKVAERNAARDDPAPIHFRGLREYVEHAADAAGLEEPDHRTKAASGWQADAIGTALSQIVERAKDGTLGQLPGDYAREALDRCDAILKTIDVQRAALFAAIGDVKAIVGSPSRVAKAVDDRKPLRPTGAPVLPGDPNRPGAHRPDRPGPPPPKPRPTPAAKVEGDAPPSDPPKPSRRSRAVRNPKDSAGEREQDKPVDKPPTDETGRILDDIDGDGDVEPVIYPGVGEPTGPPAKTQDVDRKADDEKVGKPHDSK